MIDNGLYTLIQEKAEQNHKLLSVLIDPDKQNFSDLLKMINRCNQSTIDFFLVGGSTIAEGELNKTVHFIKNNSSIPVILFPGNYKDVTDMANGILLLSLISGNNPDYLIGHHLLATPTIRKTNMEVIPTGYILVDCGKETTVVKVSKTTPIAYDDYQLADTIAYTGQLMGHKLIYLEGGSGAEKAISKEMIKRVKRDLEIPLIVGGGIRSADTAQTIYEAGADLIVIGNGAEKNRDLITEISAVKAKFNA